jgi:hypothetical protein
MLDPLLIWRPLWSVCERPFQTSCARQEGPSNAALASCRRVFGFPHTENGRRDRASADRCGDPLRKGRCLIRCQSEHPREADSESASGPRVPSKGRAGCEGCARSLQARSVARRTRKLTRGYDLRSLNRRKPGPCQTSDSASSSARIARVKLAHFLKVLTRPSRLLCTDCDVSLVCFVDS